MPKFINRERYVNNLDEYKDLIEDRGVENIEHFLSLKLNSGNYQRAYTTYEDVWKKGDKLYKLAHQYYGNIDHWWVIAFYNNKPTDAHFQVGDIVQIPYSPEEIINDIVS